MLIVLLLLLIGLAGLLWWRRRSARAPDTQDDRLDTIIAWPPQATRVLGSHERLAYLILVRALPDHMVLAQVPLARFIRVPKRHSYAEWLRRLGYQCVDLVVCDNASQVIAVVDVQAPADQTNDRSRRRALRIARTLKACGVPLHVWTEGALPSPDTVRETIAPRPPVSAEPAAAAAPEPAAATTTRPAATPFDDSHRDSSHDERIEMSEPPPSTWFDDMDSGPTPLQQKQKPPRR